MQPVEASTIIVEKDSICPICREQYINEADKRIIQVVCDHIFHKDCILEWTKNNSSCPNCRSPLNLSERKIQKFLNNVFIFKGHRAWLQVSLIILGVIFAVYNFFSTLQEQSEIGRCRFYPCLAPNQKAPSYLSLRVVSVIKHTILLVAALFALTVVYALTKNITVKPSPNIDPRIGCSIKKVGLPKIAG